MNQDLTVGTRVQHVDGNGAIAVVVRFQAYPLVTVRWESTGRESSENQYLLTPAVEERVSATGHVIRRDIQMGNGFVLREHVGMSLWDVFCGAFIGRYKTERGARRAIERMKAQQDN